MDIVFASNNQHKLREAREILSDYRILSLAEIGFCSEIEENKSSIEENAMEKVRAVRPYTDKIIIADDTGLFVEALKGAPGVYSARYAGEQATFADNNKKLLKALEKEQNRNAVFKCAVALQMPDGSEKVFVGETKGSIAAECVGEHGFGYDPVFFVEALGKTYAQMTEEEKNHCSHRAQALFALRDFFDELVK